MLNELITAITGTLILGGSYLIDLIVGIAKVNLTPDTKWSWKKMFKDFAKAILIAVGIVGIVGLLNAINWWGKSIGADLAILGDVSVATLFAGILGGSVWYVSNALKNLMTLINSKDTKVDIDTAKTNYEAIMKPIKDIYELVVPEPNKEVAVAHKEFELEGGVGQNYSVPIGSYVQFKNAVIGRGFNIDNSYGWQCWDGTALLWQQIGRSLLTGNGLAIGCWDLKRNENAGGDFNLITDVNALKEGDVVVIRPNHIGFFDGWNGGYMRILGQNQGGQPTLTQNGYTTGAFNITNISKGSFAGAFRFKRWIVTPPAPAPTPEKPATKPISQVADEVIAGKWGNGDERKQKLESAGYSYALVQAEVNRKLNTTPEAPQAPQTSVVQIRDRVTTSATKDAQNGLELNLRIINDGRSVYVGLNSNGNAVLEADGVVRCAVPYNSLRKA